MPRREEVARLSATPRMRSNSSRGVAVVKSSAVHVLPRCFVLAQLHADVGHEVVEIALVKERTQDLVPCNLSIEKF